jgi:tetratricopeptide (TPR) repeat protein
MIYTCYLEGKTMNPPFPADILPAIQKASTKKVCRRKAWGVFIILVVLLLSFSPCRAQQVQETPASESAASSAHDRRQLEQLPPGELDKLEDRLAEALTLYYDGQYGQALPIFNRIASQVETMDILWWVGTSAMKTGDLGLAADRFQKMLAVDPNLARVRLELAATYFELGRYQDARRELETVKASNPPQAVLNNIEKLLAAIEERTRKVFVNLRFSQGIQWDTNASSGPDRKELNVTGGTLSLDTESGKVRDWASITNLSGSVLYDMGEKQGLMWNTTADVYNSTYLQYGKFNYLLLDATTGPLWVGREDIVKIPFGISDQTYGSERLSHIFHIDPSYEHYFSPYFSLKAQHTFSKEVFYDSEKNGLLDNTTRRYELNPNIFLDNRRHILSFALGYEDLSAGARRYTYSAKYYTLSYFTRFPTKTDFFLKYQFADKDYKDAPLLYPDARRDRRHTYTAVLSQEIRKNFFASFAFNHIVNSSNAELYDFDKTTYTLSVGFYF